MTILILGGTAEARAVAAALHEHGLDIVSSLAGRVADLQLPIGAVRVGGFGGIDGLARYLRAGWVSAVVDATHPFAAQMTSHAVQACAATGVPLVVLRRPPWTARDGDQWTVVPDLAGAAATVPELADPAGRVLLTIGRQGAGSFAGLPQHFWIRALEAPDPPLPGHTELILQRGPFTLADERDLFDRLAIDLVVSKNSGGQLTSAKLDAARELDLPVLMIARPPLPYGTRSVDSVEAAVDWARRHGISRHG